MNKITLQVKVMSCKGIKAFNFFQKLLVYALVSVLISSDGDDKEEEEEIQQQQQQHRTQRDEEGDGDPEWNQEMQFDVDEGLYRNHSDRLLIHFELRHEGVMFGDKVIGEARIPLKDLIEDEFSSDGVARFVSYEVRSIDGKPNGVLHFSYRLLNRIPKVQPLPCTSYSSSNNVTGYPTSPRVQYPSLAEVEVEPLAVPPQQVPHSWPTQYHYPPPPPVVHGAYYYPPPPPPPPPPHPSPPPPQVHCWLPRQHVGPQDTWSSSSGEPHALGNEEMWSTPSGHHHLWSPFWNGR